MEEFFNGAAELQRIVFALGAKRVGWGNLSGCPLTSCRRQQMKNPASFLTFLAPAALALCASQASAQISLDVSGGIIGESLVCDLAGTVNPGEFVILTFSDTTGPLNVSDILPGETGFWDQDITMFLYPAFMQPAAYTNPLANADLSTLSPTLTGVVLFGQAWTTGLGTPFLTSKSNVITVILGSHGVSTPTFQPPVSPHAYFACVPLTNGNVLCSGGADSLGGFGTGATDVYDYKTSTFALTANQPSARSSTASVRLADGRVLICGGIDSGGIVLTATEIYNPVTNSFTPGANMNTARALHQAVLLNDGRVFVCGGSTAISGTDPVSQLLSVISNATSSTEIYDPVANTWTTKAAMSGGARTGHTATTLTDGRVLIAGGVQSGFLGIPSFLTSCTRYSASTNTYTATAALPGGGRALPNGLRLADGRVILTGGLSADIINQTITAVTTVSIYNNTSNTWQSGPNMTTGRYVHTATLLPNNEVLVTGGVTGTASATTTAVTVASCEAYTTTNTWAARPAMLQNRAAHGAALTKDGKRVLIVGGADDLGLINPGTSELYVP